jgi:hypothetical protein
MFIVLANAGLQDTLRAGDNTSVVTVCAYDAWGNPTYLIDPVMYMPTISTAQNATIIRVGHKHCICSSNVGCAGYCMYALCI